MSAIMALQSRVELCVVIPNPIKPSQVAQTEVAQKRLKPVLVAYLSVMDKQKGRIWRDFALPNARFLPGFKEYSSTTVKWLDALQNRVEFSAWDDFEEEVDLVRARIEDLEEKKTQDARGYIRSAKRTVVKDGLEEDDAEVDTRPVFSTCTSLAAVHGNVFSAVQEILQQMFKTRRVAIRTKAVWLGKPAQDPKGLHASYEGIKGGGLYEEGDGDTNDLSPEERSDEEEQMRDNAGKRWSGAESWGRGRRASGSETRAFKSTKELEPPTKDRTPDFTLMKLRSLAHEIGVPVVAFELKGPCLDILATPASKRGDKRSSVSAKVLAGRFGKLLEADVFEGSPSASRESGRVEAGNMVVPVSDGEKTPQIERKDSDEDMMDFSRMATPSGDTAQNDSKDSPKYEAGSFVGRSMTPGKWKTMKSGSNQEVQGRLGAQPGEASRRISSHETKTVSNEADTERNAPSASGRKPLGQALSYALSVASGCVFLYNYDCGVAIEVIPGTNDEKIHARVSRAFYRIEDEQGRGPFVAMVALGAYGMKRFSANPDLASGVQELADVVEYIASGEQKQDQQERNLPRRRGSATSKRKVCFDENINSEKRGKQQRSAVTSNIGSAMQTEERESASRHPTLLQSVIKTDDDPFDCSADAGIDDESGGLSGKKCATSTLQENSVLGNGLFPGPVSQCTSERDGVNVLSMRELHKEELLGHGRSGNVYLATLRGISVAVKEWNGIDGDGKDDLINEAEVYNMIAQKCPNVLGDAVPYLILAWTGMNTDDSMNYGEPILVTEAVGHEIQQSNDGTMSFLSGGRHFEISREDQDIVLRESMRSLSLLHSNGFAHGDISLRNIRVQRLSSRDRAARWKMWWIDLGHARRVVPSLSGATFATERSDCVSLFSSL